MDITKFRINAELSMALGFLVIFSLLLIPVTPQVLDVFIALMMLISVVIFLVSIYTKKPLDFSTFPSVLLIVTMFRLAINVASTKNILGDGVSGLGAAGEIIRSFGEVVVGGDYVVGIVIFVSL